MVNGSIKLFRLFGIDVFLHWSWFLLAVWMIPQIARERFYGTETTTMIWSSLLFVMLFVIVVVHEFGHALACKSVGGKANKVVLWPLGGLAFVQPPQRPGAMLWYVFAGPLVNIMLVPLTVFAYYFLSGGLAWPDPGNNIHAFFFSLMIMNALLLIFNLLPIYPLDGGQIFMALLWFIVGRAIATQVVSVIGMTGAALLLLLAVLSGDLMLILIAGFIGMYAFSGFMMGKKLSKYDPKDYDERYARREAEDEVNDRIQAQIDPWRR